MFVCRVAAREVRQLQLVLQQRWPLELSLRSNWTSSGHFPYGGRRLGGGALSRRAPSGARVRRAPRPIRRARRVSVPCRRDSDERRVQRAHRHALRGHRTGRTHAVESLVRSFARADAASEWRECDRHNSYRIQYAFLRALSDGRLVVVGMSFVSIVRLSFSRCWKWIARVK